MDRRQFLTRFGTAAAAAMTAPAALAENGTAGIELADLRGSVSALDYQVRPGAVDDQSARFQRMLDDAAQRGVPVFLPAGLYVISNIKLPEGASLHGVPGRTQLVYGGNGHLIAGNDLARVTLAGLTLDGANRVTRNGAEGLIDLRGVVDARIDDVIVRGAGQDGIYLERCGGRIERCTITGAARFGVYAVESAGLSIIGNRVKSCANGGIIVHRWTEGHDGTIIARNRIEGTGAGHGGTGQWGNAINVFRTDDVLIAGNRIEGSAFSAIRANSARNIQITGNNCRASGETAIYSEFSFENAVVSANVIDGAASGISVTNFDHGGRAATVSGNIVRNIVATGPYAAEPPGFGIGIAVEADTAVTGNMIEGVALYGINAGWGRHLRDCVIGQNVVRNAHIGIAFSTVEGAGQVLVSNNLIDARNGAIRGHRWAEIATGELLGARRGMPANAVLANNRTV
ncbi:MULTISPECIES: TIGR03808 family TAT-translocated repetitive protein [unclassified Roseitalea]|uniref:TIGR03808 family TAT-translocated repetitive protein n=1 Tax=unclassified Roseitalea TaxID=2639107 RepID=UPI00273FCE7A|nr:MULTISPECIES: TIGR03808 family TAT-translocated repetitive protein [unclassified Roseitalea]